MSGLLIIGASQAGVQLAVSLRALGFEPGITLVGDENHRPYQRPALSKEFLQGVITKESLIFRTEDYWTEHRIEVVKNERIVRLERCPDGSGTARALSGREFCYDRLALTVGARPRRLPLPGMDLPGVLHLRNADDALELKARVPDVSSAVVIGGGFIGLEAAASLRKLGKRVTVLEAGPRLLGRAVGAETAAEVLARHRAAGIEVLLDVRVVRATAKGDQVAGVELGDGSILPADLVLVGVGVVPNTELADAAGLACDNGILVDRQGIASDGVTVAVGDVANLPNPLGDDDNDRVRFESVNNAVEQAKLAAYAITGRPEEYRGVPWFWSNQGDIKLQIAGLSTHHDRTVVRRDDTRGRLTVLYYRSDRLVAADCIGAPLDFMAVKAALSAGATIPPHLAADPAVSLKELVVPMEQLVTT